MLGLVERDERLMVDDGEVALSSCQARGTASLWVEPMPRSRPSSLKLSMPDAQHCMEQILVLCKIEANTRTAMGYVTGCCAEMKPGEGRHDRGRRATGRGLLLAGCVLTSGLCLGNNQ